MHDRIKGSITALVTPFSNGKVDEKAFEALVERQIDNGTNGVVPMGTTGETPTLTHAEHIRVIESCVKTVAGRVPVIAGAGSNSTEEAVHLAKAAKQAGADALLCATGYYNKPQQAGLYAHFKTIHDAVELPIIVYNVPGRTVADISVDTLGQLSKLEHIVAVKDATGDLARVARHRLTCGEDFTQLSGEDITAVGFNAMGGTGCISVTANVVPDLCAKLQALCLSGQWQEAVKLQDRLVPLHDAMFCETSPGPVKYALSKLGLCQPDVRLPLMTITDASKAKVDAALKGLGLI